VVMPWVLGALGLVVLAILVVGYTLSNAIQGSGQAATPEASPSATSPAARAIGGAARAPRVPSVSAPKEASPPSSPAAESPSDDAAGDAGGGRRLPREVVQRIMRQSYPRLRACYEQGLARNSTLRGRVVLHFVIGLDGSVTSVTTPGATLADTDVVACIARRVRGLAFPAPGDTVTVTYPISFEPG
jgi:hypothetical protein